MAKRFEGAGLSRLHLVDLDGAKAKKIINGAVMQRICLETSLSVDFGGGVQ
jgi:phosphoribosylformimino-5-aminoimidazole carboxamide ribotide isomerase